MGTPLIYYLDVIFRAATVFPMLRKARIDATGALHRIIARGIERRKIFNDDHDRDSFPIRLAAIFEETAEV
jgi:hypothetical protein